MSSNTKHIKILIGLPGAGKTTFAEKMKLEKYYRWDFDRYSLENNIGGFFADFIGFYNQYKNHTIDGLFLTNNDLRKLLMLLISTNKINKNVVFEFHYFIPDREACLRNDEYRNREKNARITILNANIEEPDIEALSKEFGVKIVLQKHKTIGKSEYDIRLKKFKDKHKNHFWKDSVIYSSTWSNGGTVCNYEGYCHEIEADYEPEKNIENFPELNIFLEKIFPGMPKSIKDEIMNKLVYIDDNQGESDYYGGYEYKSCFAINVDRLYKFLDERELISMGRLAGGE